MRILVVGNVLFTVAYWISLYVVAVAGCDAAEGFMSLKEVILDK